jgi:hypothetical protein
MSGTQRHRSGQHCWYGEHCMNIKCRFFHPQPVPAQPAFMTNAQPVLAPPAVMTKHDELSKFWLLFEDKYKLARQ